jgi:hypothetical protein
VLLGIRLQLLIGPTLPVPAPLPLAEALVGAEVTHSDEGRSGFQLTFQVGRSGPSDLADFPLLAGPLLRPFNRVVLVVVFNATPRVLSDGFITTQQLSPSEEPGGSTLTVTGEDVSVMMDLEKKKQPHPAQNEKTIVEATLGRYADLLLTRPDVVAPDRLRTPSTKDQSPFQSSATDLEYLTELAGRFGHVFYVTPGRVAGQNVAHWRPPVRDDRPQPALSVNMGPSSNVDQIGFQYNAIAATVVRDEVQVIDGDVSTRRSVSALASQRKPLASTPGSAFNQGKVRQLTLSGQDPPEGSPEPRRRGGMTYLEASTLAQAKVDSAADKVVTASGQLDALRYGEVLAPRALVDLRGVGATYDGTYYVKSVTHAISRGEYKQRFTLNREGVGALAPAVRP